MAWSEKQNTDTEGKEPNLYLFFESLYISAEASGCLGSSSVSLFIFPWDYLGSVIVDFSAEKHIDVSGVHCGY